MSLTCCKIIFRSQEALKNHRIIHAVGNEAKKHLLLLYPEVQSYTSVMNKIPKLKREKQEQICEYATRVNQTYNTLQRLHPTNNYPNEVKQSDSIRKLLEVLPVPDRKWITISDPVNNTYWEVLRQILEYVAQW